MTGEKPLRNARQHSHIASQSITAVLWIQVHPESTTHLPRRGCCHGYEIATIRILEREIGASDHSVLLVEIVG